MSDAGTDLGTIGGTISIPYDINEQGLVVGDSYTSGNLAQHAFVYDGTTMRDLNDLLDSSGTGWTIAEAKGINEAGQIAGYAYYGSATVGHAVLLTPSWSVGWLSLMAKR